MSIDPERIKIGNLVVFAHPDNGWPDDVAHAKQHLAVGRLYQVVDYDIDSSSSRIWLDGIDKPFNSVQFEEPR